MFSQITKMHENENVENISPILKLLPYSKMTEGNWVKVLYEGEVLMEKL